MQTADFNHNDFSDQAEADKGLLTRFYLNPVQDPTASDEKGYPVIVEREYIEIRVAGERSAGVNRRATEGDKARFSRAYAAFKSRITEPESGTLLSEFPLITRAMAEQLAFINIKTVEQLASVSDGNIGNQMGGYAMREKAQKWLAARELVKDSEEKAALLDTIKTLQEQMAGLLAANSKVRVNASPSKEQESDAAVEGEGAEEGEAPIHRRGRNNR